MPELNKEKFQEILMQRIGQSAFAKTPDNLSSGVKMEVCGVLRYEGNSLWSVGIDKARFPFSAISQISDSASNYITIILDV